MHRQTAAQTDLSLSFLIWSRSSSSRSYREDAETTESLKMKRWTEHFKQSILELCLSVSGVQWCKEMKAGAELKDKAGYPAE